MIRLLTDLAFEGAPADGLQRQPAGYDLTVASISRFDGVGTLDLTNERRQLPAIANIEWEAGAGTDDAPAPLTLVPGGYLVTYSEVIEVPADCAGLVLPRSSLMRCGATLHSALWDPGYRGRGQGLLTVYTELRLHHQARIGQFILIRLDQAASELYSGTYQNENI